MAPPCEFLSSPVSSFLCRARRHELLQHSAGDAQKLTDDPGDAMRETNVTRNCLYAVDFEAQMTGGHLVQ
jgi:hypothetical protein